METGNTEDKVELVSSALESEKVRFARWLAVCAVFAVLATTLAMGTRSVFFSVVAALAWFFVWNRWKSWKLIRSVPKPSLSDDAEQIRWLHSVLNLIENPPQWWRMSELASAVILLGLYAVVTFFIVMTSGTWMKVLYGVSWATIVIVIPFRVSYIRKRQRRQ
jgi:hypothetical protein